MSGKDRALLLALHHKDRDFEMFFGLRFLVKDLIFIVLFTTYDSEHYTEFSGLGFPYTCNCQHFLVDSPEYFWNLFVRQGLWPESLYNFKILCGDFISLFY